jgi:ABC-type antimicrobial peptide transport system permease subunit
MRGGGSAYARRSSSRPLAMAPSGDLRLTVRTRGKPEPVLPSVRETFHEVAPAAPLAVLTSSDTMLNRQLSPFRVNAIVLGWFAFFTLVIAAVGIYGIVAYLVTQRTSENGIRMALGARPAHVVLPNMRLALEVIAVGTIVGLVGSFALTRILRSVLFDVSPTDPRIFAAAAALLALVTLGASYFPARRATRVDPARALRGSL